MIRRHMLFHICQCSKGCLMTAVNTENITFAQCDWNSEEAKAALTIHFLSGEPLVLTFEEDEHFQEAGGRAICLYQALSGGKAIGWEELEWKNENYGCQY